MTELIYNTAEARLYGDVDGKLIRCTALSGGRGGTKKSGAAHPVLVNNPMLTGVKLNEKKKDSIGGPLPTGLYTLVNHETRKNWIRLIPSASNAMQGRSGFAIHGRGMRGSDGCIVPTDFTVVTSLYDLVAKRSQKKLSGITLKVVAIGDIDWHIKRISTYNRIA